MTYVEQVPCQALHLHGARRQRLRSAKGNAERTFELAIIDLLPPSYQRAQALACVSMQYDNS